MIQHILIGKYTFPLLELDDGTPPKCGELSEDTDSAHTDVEDHSARYFE